MLPARTGSVSGSRTITSKGAPTSTATVRSSSPTPQRAWMRCRRARSSQSSAAIRRLIATSSSMPWATRSRCLRARGSAASSWPSTRRRSRSMTHACAGRYLSPSTVGREPRRCPRLRSCGTSVACWDRASSLRRPTRTWSSSRALGVTSTRLARKPRNSWRKRVWRI